MERSHVSLLVRVCRKFVRVFRAWSIKAEHVHDNALKLCENANIDISNSTLQHVCNRKMLFSLKY